MKKATEPKSNRNPKPKKTRQGKSINTKISKTSSNGKGKRYRGQG